MGIFDTTVDTFELYNQPMYAYPEVNNLEDIFVEHILGGEPLDNILKRHLMFRLGFGKLKRLNRQLGDGTYPYGRPEVRTNFKIGMTPELEAILVAEYDGPIDEEYINVGTISDFDWITSELNLPANHVQADFEMLASIDDMENGVRVPVPDYVDPSLTYDTPIDNAFYEGGIAKISVSFTYGTENNHTYSAIHDTNIGPNPKNEYWIVGLRTGGEWKVWRYDPDTNQYPQLEIPDFSFGSDGGQAEAYPSVPIRLRNQNYDEFGTEAEQKGIKKFLKPFGVKPDMLLDEVFAEDSGVDDPDTMDNIFVTFGVRVWDESESGREYLYKFFQEVFGYLDAIGAENANVNCIETRPYEYDNSDDGGYEQGNEPDQSVEPETGCHAIHVSTDHTEYDLFFASVSHEFIPLNDILLAQNLADIYYSDPRKFDGNNNLTKEYHSSSGELLRLAGYTAMDGDDVDKYLAGNGIKSPRPVDNDRLKSAVRVQIDPILIRVYDEDENLLNLEELVPEDIYEFRTFESLTRIEPIINDDDVREITYYLISSAGMSAYTVYGIGGQALIEDTETDKNKLVQLYAGSTNKLTVPIMFGLLENRYWINNNSNFAKVRSVVASVHMTIYVADVTTTSLPWWGIVLKVIQFVLSIVAFVNAAAKGLEAVVGLILAMAIAYIVVPIVIGVFGGAWWAQLIGTVIYLIVAYKSAGSFDNLYTSVTAASLTQILTTALDLVNTGAGIAAVFGNEREKEALELLAEAERDLSNERSYSDLLTDSAGNDMLSEILLKDHPRGVPKPMEPSRYFEMFDNMAEIGVGSLDIDSYLNIETELPGVAA